MSDAELTEADVDVEPGHGSESFFVLGEGLLTESRGGREQLEASTGGAAAPISAGDATAMASAATPPFRFSRMGPKGQARRPGDPQARGEGDDRRRRRRLDDPRRLHVPRPVHRPRPHLRQDEGKLGTKSRRSTCCRAARPRWTSTRCTARARTTRRPSSSTPTNGLKLGKTERVGPAPARAGLRPARATARRTRSVEP